MTNEEKLLRAIGEIDDDLIKEASIKNKKVFTPLTRGLTIAASAVIVSTLIIASSGLMQKSFDNAAGNDFNGSMGGGSAQPEGNDTLPNGNIIFPGISDNTSSPTKPDNSQDDTHFGYIVGLKSHDQGYITFELVLYQDVSKDLDIFIYGTDEHGQTALVSTTYESNNNYDPEQLPTILINLEEAEGLPSEGGKYFITIDYSELFKTGSNAFSRIDISGFGTIYKK